MYNDIVDFETAELLRNRVCGERKYAAEEMETTMDNFLGARKWHMGELIDANEENFHGNTYDAPTYADVLDWLYEEYGLIVEFRPAFTFALKERVAYYYTVWEKVEVEGRIRVLFSEDMEMCSFGLVFKEILRKLSDIEK